MRPLTLDRFAAGCLIRPVEASVPSAGLGPLCMQSERAWCRSLVGGGVSSHCL